VPNLTEKAVQLAKRAAVAEQDDRLRARHFLIAALADPELTGVLGATLLSGRTPAVPPPLAELVERVREQQPTERKFPLAPGFKALFQGLYARHGGMPPFAELLSAVMGTDDEQILTFRRANPELAGSETVQVERPATKLGRLIEEVQGLQNLLSRKVIGQRQAIQQIVDALFQARLYRHTDQQTPRAVLLFLGPPGVGKTYTAQILAEQLGDGDGGGFLHLDMSSYADGDAYRLLVGFEPSYKDARPGLLTGHVKEHPRSLILVDEIEKAHPVTQNQFLQILDRGELEDKNTRDRVSFAETIVVFTTNLGHELYSGGKGGVQDGSALSRADVLEALGHAGDPGRNVQAMSPELVSRLAKGYPILFGHLTPMDLESIARLALDELAVEFEAQLGIHLEAVDDRLITLMILHLGPDLDARTVTAGIPLMIKDALRDFLAERRDELFSEAGVFDRIRSLSLELPGGSDGEFLATFHAGGDKLLVVSAGDGNQTPDKQFPDLSWRSAGDGEQALQALRHDDSDLVLVDIDLDAGDGEDAGAGMLRTLRRLRAARPDLPVYLYTSRRLTDEAERNTIERLLAGSGARGFLPEPISDWRAGKTSDLEQARHAVLRERMLRDMFRKRQTVQFHWTSELRQQDKAAVIVLRPRDLHPHTVVATPDRGARLTFTGIPAERFADVAGAVEAKRRLGEVIGWMRDPSTLQQLGLRLPSGILLEGPPGNGKTLLARAAAGEAGLPFFAASATDFPASLVGQSEQNIRELFERAARYAPAIGFIDEIDAIAGRRSADTAQHTDSMLNQLLVSMDGFGTPERPVFVLAATNRSDLLDPALKRPGRFDLVITVDDLDLAARRQLLEIKTAGLPLNDDVALDELARAAVGLSGAQLAQVVQEAAILALRGAGPEVSPADVTIDMTTLREALTNVRFGLKQDGALPDPEQMARTAVHEAGHALVGELERPGSVHQATILPRGRALGFVESLPESEHSSLTAAAIRARIRTALAGRAAELQRYGADGLSAGCSQDLEQASRLAALAVTRFGMSQELGPVSVPVLEELAPSPEASQRARAEVETMLREQEKAVADLLRERRRQLEALAGLLQREETITGQQIAAVLERE